MTTAATISARLILDISEYNSGLDAALGKAKVFSGQLKSALGTASTIAAGALAAIGVAAMGVGTAAFLASARVSELRAVNSVLAKTAGLTQEEVTKVAASIKGQGIETAVAAEAVAQFIRANLDLSKASDLARVAQDAAVISGLNSTDTFNNITLGIVKLNTEILRTSGITVDSNTAFAEYGATIGKTAGTLSSAEKQQAFMNAVLKAGVPIAGAYAASMKEPGKVLRSMPRLINDIFVEMGSTIQGVFGPAIIAVYEFLKALSKAVSEGGALRPVLERIGKAMQPVVDAFVEWIKNIDFAVVAKNLEGFVIFIQQNLPPIVEIIKLVTWAFDSLFKMTASLPEPVRAIGAGFIFMNLAGLALAKPLMGLVDGFIALKGALFAVKAYGVAGGLIGPAMAPAIGGVTTSLGGFAAAAWAAIVPLLPFIATIALVAVAVGLLYYAWKFNFGGIQETTKILVDQLVIWFTSMGDTLRMIVELFRIAWEGGVYATLEITYQFIKGAFMANLQNLWKLLTGIAGFVVGYFTDSWNRATAAIQWVIDKMKELQAWWANMKPPEWLNKGGGLGGAPMPGPGHAAMGGYHSGMTIVGERGPELVSLPKGSYVHTASESKGMMGGGMTVNLNINGDMIASQRRELINASTEAAMQAFAQAMREVA